MDRTALADRRRARVRRPWRRQRRRRRRSRKRDSSCGLRDRSVDWSVIYPYPLSTPPVLSGRTSPVRNGRAFLPISAPRYRVRCWQTYTEWRMFKPFEREIRDGTRRRRGPWSTGREGGRCPTNAKATGHVARTRKRELRFVAETRPPSAHHKRVVQRDDSRRVGATCGVDAIPTRGADRAHLEVRSAQVAVGLAPVDDPPPGLAVVAAH